MESTRVWWSQGQRHGPGNNWSFESGNFHDTLSRHKYYTLYLISVQCSAKMLHFQTALELHNPSTIQHCDPNSTYICKHEENKIASRKCSGLHRLQYPQWTRTPFTVRRTPCNGLYSLFLLPIAWYTAGFKTNTFHPLPTAHN